MELNLDWERRTALRQEKIVPVLRELSRRLDENYLTVRPKCQLGQAVAYAKARWACLSAYAMHGQMKRQQPAGECRPPVAVGERLFCSPDPSRQQN